MVCCAVPGCDSSKDYITQGYSFHRFPTCPDLKKRWLRMLNRPNWTPAKYSTICSKHFRENCFRKGTNRMRVRYGSVPTICMPSKFNFEASNVEACRICLATDVKMYTLQDTYLGRCIDSVVGINNSGLPNCVCFECAACLMKCNKLIEKSWTAQATLQDIFDENGEVTKTLIEAENRSELNLQSSLDNSDPLNFQIDRISDLNTSDCIKAETDLEEPLDDTIKNEIKEELPHEGIDMSDDLNVVNTISGVPITEGVNQMGKTEDKAEKERNKMKNMKVFTFVEAPKETYMQKYFNVEVIPVQKTNTKKYMCKFCPKSFNNIDEANNHRVAGCSVSQGTAPPTSSSATSCTGPGQSFFQVESPSLQNMKRINTGMTEKPPLGSPLETPHAKRPKTLDCPGVDDCHSGSLSTFRESASTEATATAFQPEPPGFTAATLVLQLEPHGDRIAQPCQGNLDDGTGNSDDEINILEYGSEEDEKRAASDDECELHLPIPRIMRVLVEADEDTPLEAQAAGRVVTTTAKCAKAARNVSKAQRPTTLFDFEWLACPLPPISPHLRRETFVGSSGPLIGPILSPYEAFVLIWDRPIMERIVLQTNLYAQKYAKQLLERGEIGPKSRITLWRDTDVDELYVYFALLVAMGILGKSKLEEYWSNDKNIFSTPGFSVNMSLKRFQLLSKCLHFNNNSNFSLHGLTHSEAKLFKVLPILNHLNLKFSNLYSLGQNIALDESLTQWKGWRDVKQVISNKDATVGIKMYEVCDSRTGYLWKFECHGGDEVEDPRAVIPGSIPNLVLRLLRGLEYRGHTVWMGSYFNSPALARVLKSLGYDCAGTVRTNRQFVPDQIVHLKNADMGVGQVRGYTSGDIDLVVWRNQNCVAMISTYHGVTVSEKKPTLIKDYVCMGGVDKKDRVLSSYPMERERTQVWYKKLFRRLLNVSVFNAHVLYKHTRDIKHREFRMGLVTEILDKHQTSRSDYEMAMVRGFPKFSAEIISHLPIELSGLPGGDKRSGKKRRLCVVCKTKRTHLICQGCDVALCFDFSNSSCYIKYHT